VYYPVWVVSYGLFFLRVVFVWVIFLCYLRKNHHQQNDVNNSQSSTISACSSITKFQMLTIQHREHVARGPTDASCSAALWFWQFCRSQRASGHQKHKKKQKQKTPPQHSRRLYAALRTSTRLAVGGYVDRGSEALLYVGSSLGLWNILLSKVCYPEALCLIQTCICWPKIRRRKYTNGMSRKHGDFRGI
jgi:hypothetical protein